VLLSGTSTRSAPAGRRPPKPSRQVHTFMKKPPPAPASGRVASPATATKPTPKAANLKRTAADANLKPADIRSFFGKK
jgi:hypothetical protein